MATSIRIADIISYTDPVDGTRRTGRVTHYYKRIEDDLDEWAKAPKDTAREITCEILLEERERERNRRKSGGLPCERRYSLTLCVQEEATHLSLSDGATVRVEECEFLREVGWTKEHVEEVRKEALFYAATEERFREWYWE